MEPICAPNLEPPAGVRVESDAREGRVRSVCDLEGFSSDPPGIDSGPFAGGGSSGAEILTLARWNAVSWTWSGSQLWRLSKGGGDGGWGSASGGLESAGGGLESAGGGLEYAGGGFKFAGGGLKFAGSGLESAGGGLESGASSLTIFTSDSPMSSSCISISGSAGRGARCEAGGVIDCVQGGVSAHHKISPHNYCYLD
jgi:hypothetical protein